MRLNYKFIIYLLRWQIAGILVYPVPIMLFGLNYGTVVGSLIGGFVFWQIDKWLTKNRGDKNGIL